MASKTKKGQKSKKWSGANTMNFVLGAIVAVSMVMSSIFVFGAAQNNGTAPSQSAPQIINNTAVPSPTIGFTPTPAPTKTPTP